MIQVVGKFLVILLLAIGFFVGTLTSVQIQSLAAPLTPEAAQYEINSVKSPQQAGAELKQRAQDYKAELKEDARYTKDVAKDVTEGTQSKLEQAFETVKEKLNLDEPLPESTKEFLGDVEEKVDETVAPITGERPGYFKYEREPVDD